MTQDFTSMNNPKFLYLAELQHPFPAWVASQPMPETADFEKKASTAFADPKRRLLPICTKEAAFHSALNIFARPNDFDEAIFERVKAACAHYNIEQDILPYANLFLGEMEKEAALTECPEGRFAIDTVLGGEEFQLLPINDGEDVVSSSFDLAKMAADRRIHLLHFVSAAREIVKAAEDYDISQLPEIIVRYGTERHDDADTAARLIDGREHLCKDASIQETVAADYKAALEGLEENPDQAMEKIAAIDLAAGVEHSYKLSSMVPNPFDIVFGGPLESDAEKAAKENVLVRDVLIPLDEVQNISALGAGFRLSKTAAETFVKLRDLGDARDLSLAIETWPEDDQKTFLRMAVESAA